MGCRKHLLKKGLLKMPQADFTLITNQGAPIYSEECDSYLNPGSAKARRLFMKGFPSPKGGISAFYCLNKAGFKGLDGDSVSLRMSYQNHYDETNNAKSGDVGLFAFADKAKIQARADLPMTATYNQGGNMDDHAWGIQTMQRSIHTGNTAFCTLGDDAQHNSYTPNNLDGSADFQVKDIGDWQHLRLDITLYTDSGVKKVKIKHFKSKKNVAYPTTEAAWDGADFLSEEKISLHQSIFDYDNDGAFGEAYWGTSGGGTPIFKNDPVEGSLTNSDGAATEMACGFVWRDGSRDQDTSDQQDRCPQVTIGHFEMRVKSDTI
jgi:hypothetical protein